jgi:hypothetical protein
MDLVRKEANPTSLDLETLALPLPIQDRSGASLRQKAKPTLKWEQPKEAPMSMPSS